MLKFADSWARFLAPLTRRIPDLELDHPVPVYTIGQSTTLHIASTGCTTVNCNTTRAVTRHVRPSEVHRHRLCRTCLNTNAAVRYFADQYPLVGLRDIVARLADIDRRTRELDTNPNEVTLANAVSPMYVRRIIASFRADNRNSGDPAAEQIAQIVEHACDTLAGRYTAEIPEGPLSMFASLAIRQLDLNSGLLLPVIEPGRRLATTYNLSSEPLPHGLHNVLADCYTRALRHLERGDRRYLRVADACGLDAADVEPHDIAAAAAAHDASIIETEMRRQFTAALDTPQAFAVWDMPTAAALSSTALQAQVLWANHITCGEDIQRRRCWAVGPRGLLETLAGAVEAARDDMPGPSQPTGRIPVAVAGTSADQRTVCELAATLSPQFDHGPQALVDAVLGVVELTS